MNKTPGIPLPDSPSRELYRKNREAYDYQASPHVRGGVRTRNIMLDVLIALAPAVLGSLFFFGARVLLIYVCSIGAALVADIAVQRLKKQKPLQFDLSAVVTGTLLAMSLPANMPFWMVLLGAAFGVVVGKELFGGIGKNFLNPALTGRALLRLVFPAETMQNPMPAPPFGAGQAMDAVASATPLMMIKNGQALTNTDLLDAFLGTVGGKLGETSALLLLIGAAWLLYKGIIRWRIPVSILLSMAAMAFVLSGDWRVVLGHLLGGATILVAFFMATDYGSSPSAPASQIFFGVLCGVAIMLFRLYSPYSEGATFAILLANCTVPLFNRFVRPRVLGEGA